MKVNIVKSLILDYVYVTQADDFNTKDILSHKWSVRNIRTDRKITVTFKRFFHQQIYIYRKVRENYEDKMETYVIEGSVLYELRGSDRKTAHYNLVKNKVMKHFKLIAIDKHHRLALVHKYIYKDTQITLEDGEFKIVYEKDFYP